MINFAHRGNSFDYPENTLIAFKEAIKCKATGIELDVHKSKDNKLVIIHDEDIERTYNGKGLVKDYTLSELKRFKNRKKLFKDLEESRIIELKDVLDILKNENMLLNIELKTDIVQYENIEDDVVNLLKKYNMENKVIISSFNHASIMKCKLIDKNIRIGVLYSNKTKEDVVSYAKCLGAYSIHLPDELVSKDLVKKAHDNELKVNVYTVNNPTRMRELIKWQVDGIFTDMPCLLNEIEEKNNI